MSEEKTCVICGKSFSPFRDEDECCSPVCRALLCVRKKDADNKKRDDEKEKELHDMKKPPKFDLERFPKARVKWFMSLDDERKKKFHKYLSPEEVQWARAMAQKNLSEERFFTDFYVKNGKIIENKPSVAESVSDADEVNEWGDKNIDSLDGIDD